MTAIIRIEGEELTSTRVVASGVESNQFTTEEVVARGDTVGDLDGDLAAVGNELVDSPRASVVAILVDLEPTAGRSRASGRGDLGEVGHDWALVGSINDHAGEGRVEGEAPLHGDGITSLDGLDIVGDLGERVGSTVAAHGGAGDILEYC